MTTASAHAGQSTRFSIERLQGKSPSTLIFRFTGPFTARKMYGHLTPDEFQNVLAFQSVPGETLPQLNILDLSEVPYMDSMGLGMIVTHYVRSTNNGVKTIAAGLTPRVLELFQLTKVDNIIPLAPTVDQAE